MKEFNTIGGVLIIPNIESLKVQLELKNGTIHDKNDSQNEYQIIKFNGYEKEVAHLYKGMDLRKFF